MENKILATVGGNAITEADVSAFIAELGQRGAAYDNPQGRAMVLGQLINSKLFLLDAQRNLIEGEAEFRDRLRRVKENLLTNYAVEKIIAPIRVTDAEAKAFYDENPDKFQGEETVNASHILVESKEKALEVYAKIAGAEMTFEQAAKEYSSCPSKEQGGALGEFGRGQMVPEFDTAVFSMQVGEVTAEPVKTQFGYHLIRLNNRQGATPLSFEEMKDSITEQLLREKQSKAYESRINQLKIVYPVDILA